MPESLGPCPLCQRPMLKGRSVNRHHLIPKSYGGKESYWIHIVCHSKIHSLFKRSELFSYYHTFERLREHQDIQKFIKWIAKKPPEFRTRNHRAKRKG